MKLFLISLLLLSGCATAKVEHLLSKKDLRIVKSNHWTQGCATGSFYAITHVFRYKDVTDIPMEVRMKLTFTCIQAAKKMIRDGAFDE